VLGLVWNDTLCSCVTQLSWSIGFLNAIKTTTGRTMPGTAKLRSVKKFGQENDSYEFSDEGKWFSRSSFKTIRKSVTCSIQMLMSLLILLQRQMVITCKFLQSFFLWNLFLIKIKHWEIELFNVSFTKILLIKDNGFWKG